MNWITPPECQGQIVLYSYCLDGETNTVYRRRYDQNDQSTSYFAAKALASDEGDYQNGAPANKRWRKVTAEQIDQIEGE